VPDCCGPATVVHDDRLVAYDFGPGHPMSPLRVDLTVRLAAELGVLGPADGGDGGAPSPAPGRVRLVPAPVADDDRLATVHSRAYIEAVRRHDRAADASAHPTDPPDLTAYGLGTEDNPAFAHMHEATAHVVGATVEACRQVWSGESLHSANITGGLHHAMPDRASGFCVYNDVAVGIAWLLEQGVERVAYVDVDAHHGDGVEACFAGDPRVLTISLHESGEHLFPGTGRPGDVGGPGAEGYAVNVALPPGTRDAGWLRAFDAVVPELLREFGPQVLVTQHGCDSHADDPLAHLALSVEGQRAAALALHDLAHELCGGRWVATGGGGYSIVEVVPRTWTHLLATVGGRPLDPTVPTPPRWRAHVEAAYAVEPPATLGDLGGDPGGDPGSDPGGGLLEGEKGPRDTRPVFRPWSAGYDPGDDLDRSVHATRTVVFPLHGLDPLAW